MPIKLNLGVGTRKREEYIGVDIREGTNTDVVADITKPLPYKDNSVDEIYSSHIIEHFWYWEVEKILNNWYNALKIGGICDTWTVDMDIVNNEIKKAEDYDRIKWCMRRLFNKNDYPGEEHHNAFNYKILKMLYEKVGFKNIQRLENDKDHPDPLFHRWFNLGIRGYK